MRNIFDSLTHYQGNWNVKDVSTFNEAEIAAVESATVVPTKYGNSVCFMMKTGDVTYIPLSQNSTKGVGEEIDLRNAKLLTLEKHGEADILRVEA